jgi:hypothetical protein
MMMFRGFAPGILAAYAFLSGAYLLALFAMVVVVLTGGFAGAVFIVGGVMTSRVVEFVFDTATATYLPLLAFVAFAVSIVALAHRRELLD